MQYIIESLTKPLCELTIFRWLIVIIFTLLVFSVVSFLLIMQYVIGNIKGE